MTDTDRLEYESQIASTSSNVSVNQFQKYLADDSLELRPPFQRNLVWNEEQRSFLVDSILRGLPVPEIYVQISTSAEGEEHVVVVDGQQRISACLQFLADDLRLVGDDDLDPKWRNSTFSELSPELQKRFRSYELIVRRLPDLGDGVLREIFRRLNKTVEALVAQELRHAAYTGPFIRFVESAGSQPVLSEIGVFTARDYLRRRSDELMAEIAFALVSRAYPNKKEGLDELFLTYERQGVPEGALEDLGARFGRVFAQLEPIAGTLRRTRFRNKSDFYTLFIGLAKSAERLPRDRDSSEALAAGLREFSSLVNDIKREEGEGRAVESLVKQQNGRAALTYLGAVERAASDRLSRVRREEALNSVLGPLLATGAVTELSAKDAAWLTEPALEDEDEDDEDVEVEEDSARARAVLLTDSEVE